ncbi:gamma-glutamyltransferase [Seongchinamella sediminis]|uniref:Glutathione hydrolase proenzyme n=1 Tax=Seongchinamella sediminis TaxID=2283635 RepID=A0A3L7E2T1_9GAMM|nr:gamma-glutamyltransferase [Seongchinamella sediminis]RLQ23389.1 gamma-glutamyltransferase [Seongchinamella sediminis]
MRLSTCKVLFAVVTLSLLQACASQPEVSRVPAELGAGGRPVGEIWSRSPVYGSRGMAATAQPLASQVALDILKQGGSAVDAAIAANAALGLMEPTGNGIGGDIFVIVWDPQTRQLYGYNGSGRSPGGQSLAQLQARIDALKERGELPADARGIPSHGPLPVTVPGTVDGWFALHERFGKLPMSQILAPTIDYAREGFPVSPVIAYYFDRSWAFFSKRFADSPHLDNIRNTWFPGGRAAAPGELLTNRDLADTLETIALEGRDAFYKGSLARRMADYFETMEGGLAYRDFSEHRGEWVVPGSVNYRGYDLYELPPNGQGYAALQMLSILKNVDLGQWPRASAEVFHYMVEAKRLAFEDVARYYADPAFADLPLSGLLSDGYGRQRFAEINPSAASPTFGPGEPALEGEGDTTYLTVADESGMMVSLIQSNYRGMGSGMVADGTGFMFQDRGELFSLDPEHPNAYQPGKRPFHTIIPAFLMKDGEPLMSFGLMGGGMQPQGHVQVLVNMLDYGMNVQEAGDAARFLHDGGRQPTGVNGDPLGTLYLEPGVPAGTVERLRAMGHKVEIDSRGVRFGGYQAIMVDREKGSYAGATEMRKDGTVVAW